MSDDKKIKLVCSFVKSAIAAALFTTAATILAELYPPFKDFLKINFYHHWMGKGVISFAIFSVGGIICYILPHRRLPELAKLSKCVWILSLAAILGTLAIFGFFVYEFYSH